MFEHILSAEREVEWTLKTTIPDFFKRKMGNCAQRLRGTHKTPGAILDRVISQVFLHFLFESLWKTLNRK